MSPPMAARRWSLLLLLAVGCVVQGPPVIFAPAGGPLPAPAAAPAMSVPETSRIVDLQYGGSFCALREDGRVACWGYNDGGSLGDGTNEARSRPALVPGLDRVKRLMGMPSLGFCALRADTSLWCWGFAYVGDISMPTAGVPPRPVAERVRDFGFAEKWPGVCARREDGAVSCSEFRTERGPGCAFWADQARSSCLFLQNRVVVQPRAFADAGQVRFGQAPISWRGHETCALAGGRAVCQASSNFDGVLGDPALSRAEVPTPVPGLEDVVSVSDSGVATCAVRADGVASCWGRNRDHELIVPPDPEPCPVSYPPEGESCNRRPTPLPVADVAQVILTLQEMVVLTRTGVVLRSGPSGGPRPARPRTLELVPGIPPAARLVRGSRYPYATCALTRAGEVYCFGRGAHLGDGTLLASREPRQIRGVRDAVEVRADLTTVCARGGEGTVSCWGDPEAPRGLRDIVALGNPCALARDGRVWCWGANAYGEMGLGRRMRPGIERDPDIVHVPLPVPGLHGVTAISSTLGTTCVLSGEGAARCWGVWGPKFPTLSPTLIAGIPPAREIWSGEGRQCALARDGHVSCWATGVAPAAERGLGAVSHLQSYGPGTADSRQTCVIETGGGLKCLGGPAPLPDFGHVEQVSVSRDPGSSITRGCALLATRELVCWGAPYCAQGSAVCTSGAWNEPHRVLDGVKQVSVGTYLACAVRSDGTVWCWGSNEGGGLGGGSVDAQRFSRVDLVHLGQ
jgi:alpha-tubulin suppressor-like RCC1 family protein